MNNEKNFFSSKYNIIEEMKEYIIIYNTMSGGMVKVNKRNAQEQLGIMINSETLSSAVEVLSADDDYSKKLFRNSMIIDKNFDELALLKYFYYSNKYRKNNLAITINTGLTCNFACTYCYQAEKSVKKALTKQRADSILKFIYEYVGNNSTPGFSFIGGEPFSNLNILEYMVDSLIDRYGDVMFDVYTNGYTLNHRVLELLERMKIKGLQISVDGPKHYHDRKRIRRDGKGTYDRLIENINTLTDRGIHTTIRCHIDRQFMDEVQLLPWIESLKGDIKHLDACSLYMAPIVECGQGCTRVDHDVFTYIIESYKALIDNGIRIPLGVYFRPTTFGCAANSQWSININWDGKLYKCWHDLTSENAIDERSMGDVENGFNVMKNIRYVSSFDPFDQECKTCIMLPLCHGGCPEYRHSGYNKCTHLKDFYGEILSLYLQQVMGFEKK